MGYAPRVKQYKYKNIAVALAACLLVVLAISTLCSSSAKDTKLQNNTVSSEASSKPVENSSSKFESEKLTSNYQYISITNDTEIGNGNLVVVNSDHHFSGTLSDTDTVYSYLFDDKQNQIMYASNTSISADKTTFVQFNKIVQDFYSQKKLATLMIVGGLNVSSDTVMLDDSTASSSADTEAPVPDDTASDNATGLALDLQLYLADEGTYPSYTGDGDYSWIQENCWKYGFVLRYPADKSDITGNAGSVSHFRYVGEPFAEIMTTNNLALEELSDYLKNYSFEKPMSFQAYDDKCYVIYYVQQGSDAKTKIPVPLDENNNEYSYTMSGNNIDGYIVCVSMSDAGASDTDDTSSAVQSDDTSVVEQ